MAVDVGELKSEWAVIGAKLQDLRFQISELEGQKLAFEKVIGFYDPTFKPTVPTAKSKLERKSSWNSSSGRVTELLKGKNNRHVVLEILRRLGRPASSAEIARQFSSDINLGEEAAPLETAMASRFSATLDGLMKQGLVRQAGTIDGRRHLWEINRQSGGMP